MALSRSQQTKLAQGWALYQQDRLDEAFAAFEAVRRVAPRDPQCLKLLGLVAMRRKQPAQAVELFTGALRGLPADASIHNNLGNAQRELGQHDDALASLDRALAISPTIADLHNNRGNILLDLGRPQEALGGFDRAIVLKPAYPEAFFNRATARNALGELTEALGDLERAIALRPTYSKAHGERGRLLLGFGRAKEALAAFSRAVAIEPDGAELQYWHGVGLARLRRPAEALASFDKALTHKSDFFDALIQRATMLSELGRHEEALTVFDAASNLQPGAALPYSNRANALLALKRPDEALASCDQAIAMLPELAEAHCTRGTVLRALDRLEEACESYRYAIALKPNFAEAWYNYGVVELDRQEITLARDYFNQALAIDPDYAAAHFNLGIVDLLLGDLAAGFLGYEWRTKLPDYASDVRYPWPIWRGTDDLAGRHLFLHWEQGFGDTIQFGRYALLVRERGARVTLSVQAPLRALMATLHPEIAVLSDAERPPGCDFHCPVMGLPLAFGTTLASIPKMGAYLSADPDRVAAWRGRLGPGARRRVGLVWSGNAQHSNDRNRSFALTELAPILACDADFIALQNVLRPQDIADMAGFPNLRHFGAWQTDFADTAALIAELHLVISVDTSVAHLAGALGKPTWTMLPPNPDFRWMLKREDTPWYPSMRLFRPDDGGRGAMVARVAACLDGLPV